MSRYLVDRIAAQTEHRGADRHRRSRRWRAATAILKACAGATATGEDSREPIRHLFLFIGADPNTDWLAQCGVTLDAKGFVRTGAEMGAGATRWRPAAAASSRSATCASGSVKRVAAAVGEGAQVVAALHAYLAQAGRTAAQPALQRRI